MKVVVLAGGLGTRLAEETTIKPKPMVEIGEKPVLWHIMKHYAHFGFTEFLVALGYKGDVIKRYFLDYYQLSNSMTIRLAEGAVEVHDRASDDWTVHLIDTGLATNTGGRLKRLQPWLRDETFMLTYGDGVSDVNLNELVSFHKQHDCIATVTAVRPPSRFGGLAFDGHHVSQFIEKPQIGEGWINGGFQVYEPEVFEYIRRGDATSLEADVLEAVAADRKLCAFRHERFWQCMDTLRDKRLLDSMWESDCAPWKVWG